MKFLCGNCKAKYQIADEKVSGKTLRMKCRRCGHDILIDGHSMPASSSPPAASASSASTRRAGTASVVPSAPRGGSGAQALPPRPVPPAQGLPRPTTARSKPPSALGTEFRRHMAAPPEVPQRAAYDLWHAAINDVPVGPMTREELARKIEAGAVGAESLCWREGMDDWRPLGELPELSQLLRRSRDGGPRSGRPPPRHRPPPHVPAPQGARSISQYPEVEELAEDYSEPTRLAEPSQVTSALGGHAHAGGTSPKIVVPAAVQAGPGSADASVVAPLHQAPGGWSPMYSGIVVGLLAGILLVAGPMLYKSFWASAPTAAATQTGPNEPANPNKSVEVAARDIHVEVPSAAEDKPAPANVSKTGKPAMTGVKPTKIEGKDDPGKQLSAEERALLERMGVGGKEINLGPRPQQNENAGAGTGPALTPTQLSKVVQDNKVQLQRCYETALRASGGRQDGTIKVKVAVTVGMSGTTKSASTDGAGLGNMNDCIRSAVKRWRFPQSGGESQFEFPLVFQPGA